MSAVEVWPRSGLDASRPLRDEQVGARDLVGRGTTREIVVGGPEPRLELFDHAPTSLGCAGVDGCAAGWVVATRSGVHIVTDIAEVFGAGHTVVGIDMPIGLPHDAPRAADFEARRFLSPRGSTIFPTPPRACLDATDYLDASRISADITGKKLTKQTWNIVAKMRAVDTALDVRDEQRIIEVHPECAFAVMNGDRPLSSKHDAKGIEARAAFIEREFGPVDRRLRGAGRDDILDAYAALWTAERYSRGEHRQFPSDHEQRDSRGLLMRIVS